MTTSLLEIFSTILGLFPCRTCFTPPHDRKTDQIGFLDNPSLNLMHKHWVKDLGYLIHPRIPIEQANLRVADIGTGTA